MKLKTTYIVIFLLCGLFILSCNNKGKETNNFARYSGIAFQMLATIGLFTFIGYKIDEYKGSIAYGK